MATTPVYVVIIKNNSGSSQTIDELGVTIANGSLKTLSNNYTYSQIADSDILRNLVALGSLVVNDGTADLTATNG